MQRSKFSCPATTPQKDARLITSGCYKYIRHPMYTSLFIGAAGLAIMSPSGRVTMLLGLTVILFLN